MSTSSNPIARLWRTILPRRGSVARASDRFQAGVGVFVVLLALAALPVTAGFGSETYIRQQAQSAQQLGERTRVTATLLADGPPMAVNSRAGVVGSGQTTDATWVLTDGTRRAGQVAACYRLTVFSLDRFRLARWQQEWFQLQERKTHS